MLSIQMCMHVSLHTSGAACNQNNENSTTYDEMYLVKLFEVTKT